MILILSLWWQHVRVTFQLAAAEWRYLEQVRAGRIAAGTYERMQEREQAAE